MGAGPSAVPAPVLAAQSRPPIGHLDGWFLGLADETNALLRQAFRTENRATFPVSGTGSAGMETMLVNFLEPGDRVVVGICGLFGRRIADAAERLGVEVIRVEAPTGEAVRRMELEAAMRGGAAALAVVHGETSTGVAQPLEGLSALARCHDALLFVDTVTRLGGYPLDVDALGIDVAFSGTQKCLNCPPSLAPITISDRALERLGSRQAMVPSWCFDVEAVLGYWQPGGRSYHHTPPVNAIYGLYEGLRLLCEQGLENRWARHRAASAALIAGLETIGARALVQEEPPANRAVLGLNDSDRQESVVPLSSHPVCDPGRNRRRRPPGRWHRKPGIASALDRLDVRDDVVVFDQMQRESSRLICEFDSLGSETQASLHVGAGHRQHGSPVKAGGDRSVDVTGDDASDLGMTLDYCGQRESAGGCKAEFIPSGDAGRERRMVHCEQGWTIWLQIELAI